MKKLRYLFISLLLISVITVLGVVPQKWTLINFDDFLTGKFEGISVTYDGVLSLSPKEEIFVGPDEEFYLSLFIDSEGSSFLGTGHDGKIYKVTRDGKFELYFQVPEMDITCLVLDRRGNLFAGTSPNGNIWKITEQGKGEVFFNPQEKYIWDLEFAKNGNLLAAVGEGGGIYEITQDGEGVLIFDVEENHILCMMWDEDKNLIAGSGGRGLLYRLAEGKKESVLFESPYEEIKSITSDGDGNIYAACGGKIIQPKSEKNTIVPTGTAADVTITVSAEATSPVPAVLLGDNQPSSLYKVSPEGVAKTLWQSNEELIYSLFWNEQKRQLLFGTGKNGRIYAIEKNEKVSLICQRDSEQIYLLEPFGSTIFTLANNPASFLVLHPEQRFEGVYTSRIFDTKNISSWGKIDWKSEVPDGASLQIQTRSGNSKEPNQTWSDWSPPYSNIQGEQILSPKARFLQFKILFKALSGRATPRFYNATLFYLQTNVPPLVSGVELLPSNEVFLKPLSQDEIIWGQHLSSSEKAKNNDRTKMYMATKKVQRKGFQTILWDAEDKNGDSLLFSIFIRNEDESKWRMLKEGWVEKIFAFDTLSFPDGNYFIKIEAEDSPSNPLGMDLKSEKISRLLIIDNSLPVIKNFQVDRNKDSVTIRFLAEDTSSFIKDVQFLIRPDEWRTIFPKDGICDSKIEEFEMTVVLPPKADNLITIKVKDSRDNVGVARQII